MQKNKGITLVALVITIIILIILAGVTIVMVFNEDGIISRAKEAGFKTNFSEVQEKTMLHWTKEQQEDIMNGQSRTVAEKLPLGSQANITSPNNDTLIAEIREVRGDENLNVSSLELYEIDKSIIESNVPHKYIIDIQTLEIYDYDGEYFRGKWHHTLRGLGVEGGTGEVVTPQKESVSDDGEKRNGKNGIEWYAPNMNGFDSNFTSLIYYSSDFSTYEPVPVKNYLNNNKPSTIQKEESTYTLDDYTAKTWANAKTVANGLEAWWVWIPRFAYCAGNSTNKEMDIVFVDKNNNPMGSTYENDYTVEGETITITSTGKVYTLHPAFKETTKTVEDSTITETKVKDLTGIWMSKYNPSFKSVTEATAITAECYAPDMTGFDRENTYIELFNKDSNTFTEEKQLKNVNLDTVNNNKQWYDYSQKVWANVKTNANGLEAWWVWIPRFAYKPASVNQTSGNSDGDKEMNIIFVDTNNKPMDAAKYGNVLPEGFITHPAFDEKDGKKLKGIWVSKYNPSFKSVTEATAITAECYAPDMSNFDENNTYIELYDRENDTFLEDEILLKNANLNTVNNNKQWYDYSQKIWANIKTNANNQECWWVWIPRFAYKPASVNQTSGNTDGDKEMHIIFIDTNNKPMDTAKYGNDLPEGFIVHPAFVETTKEIVTNEDETTSIVETKVKDLKGIWMSKYNPSES